MTENQWTRTASPSPFERYDEQYDNPGPVSPSGTANGSASKADAVREETSQVAGQAAGAAQGVAETAKTEASAVVSEAKSNARDLLHQATSDLTSQAGAQQQKVAEGIRSISSELRTMADAPDQPGIASDLIRQAADRSQSVASWLDGRDPGSLLTDVTSFARQRPGTFLMLAAGAGVLAGRLSRSLGAGAPETPGQRNGQATTAPAVPAQGSAGVRQETVFAAGDDRGLFEEPVIATGAPVSTQSLPHGTATDTPLRDEDDPFASTPVRDTEGRHL